MQIRTIRFNTLTKCKIQFCLSWPILLYLEPIIIRFATLWWGFCFLQVGWWRFPLTRSNRCLLTFWTLLCYGKLFIRKASTASWSCHYVCMTSRRHRFYELLKLIQRVFTLIYLFIMMYTPGPLHLYLLIPSSIDTDLRRVNFFLFLSWQPYYHISRSLITPLTYSSQNFLK